MTNIVLWLVLGGVMATCHIFGGGKSEALIVKDKK